MKKGVIILLIAVLMFAVFYVNSQENSSVSENSDVEDSTELTDITEITEADNETSNNESLTKEEPKEELEQIGAIKPGSAYATRGTEFCGISMKGNCTEDSDCNQTGKYYHVCRNKNYQKFDTTYEYRSCYNFTVFSKVCKCEENQCQWEDAEEESAPDVYKEKLGTDICPKDCICSGTTTKCMVSNERDVTVVTEESGNKVVEVKNIEMTTKVDLYKEGEDIYGDFNGDNKKILLPDELKKVVDTKLKNAKLTGFAAALLDDGTYNVSAKKDGRLFYFIPVKKPVSMKVNAETGGVLKMNAPWWDSWAVDMKEL